MVNDAGVKHQAHDVTARCSNTAITLFTLQAIGPTANEDVSVSSENRKTLVADVYTKLDKDGRS